MIFAYALTPSPQKEERRNEGTTKPVLADPPQAKISPEGRGIQPAWVVFHGQADLPWLRLLKPGYRHCYVILRAGDRWLSVDPMLNRMEVQVHNHLPADFDLPGWLASRGQQVVRAVIDETKARPAPWRPFTCVEAVKRVLGLHGRFIVTPWQLYRFLTQPSEAFPRKRESRNAMTVAA